MPKFVSPIGGHYRGTRWTPGITPRTKKNNLVQFANAARNIWGKANIMAYKSWRKTWKRTPGRVTYGQRTSWNRTARYRYRRPKLISQSRRNTTRYGSLRARFLFARRRMRSSVAARKFSRDAKSNQLCSKHIVIKTEFDTKSNIVGPSGGINQVYTLNVPLSMGHVTQTDWQLAQDQVNDYNSYTFNGVTLVQTCESEQWIQACMLPIGEETPTNVAIAPLKGTADKYLLLTALAETDVDTNTIESLPGAWRLATGPKRAICKRIRINPAITTGTRTPVGATNDIFTKAEPGGLTCNDLVSGQTGRNKADFNFPTNIRIVAKNWPSFATVAGVNNSMAGSMNMITKMYWHFTLRGKRSKEWTPPEMEGNIVQNNKTRQTRSVTFQNNDVDYMM